ncbi:DUF1772 domain-containing protein [Alloalcanivorax xenomutans]|uniref:anthrone oxygenase family protein n=1 Tax=Alloalcanivorax xenomutans TaxID=1094342 RepID=UPI001F396B98|nr:anthrone oxygenase family protein [Alloalcanivorax xenomutans]MCE7522375.1 DUF1772 domain-containing protein [Alloalcanivorax xenomutans]
MSVLILFLLCIGAGIIAGVFFAFSSFIMKALAGQPPEHGADAMRRINVTVLNPGFLGIFMSSAILSVAAIVAAFVPWHAGRSLWMIAAGVCYLLGTFLVTMLFNVPRNERLARMTDGSQEAHRYWALYLREWTFWNHVRALAAALSAATAAMALWLMP